MGSGWQTLVNPGTRAAGRPGMTGGASTRGTIASLQAGRAIAALMVVFHHAAQKVDAYVADIPPPFEAVFHQGMLGVDFFFVLSGFIIAYTMHGIAPSLAAARHFLWKRALRIYTPYWPVGIAVALAYTAMPALSGAGRDWAWAPSITLLPYASVTALPLAWSLQHEIVFYLIFALLFLAGHVRAGLAIWAVLIVAASLSGPGLERPWRFLFHPINLEFIFGVVAAWAHLSGRRLAPPATLAGIVAPLALFAALGAPPSATFLVGLAIAFALPPVCRMELDGRLRVGPRLLLLGAASYALYLVHDPLISVVSRVLGSAAFGLWLPAMLLLAALSVAAALAYHLVWERPVLRAAGRGPAPGPPARRRA